MKRLLLLCSVFGLSVQGATLEEALVAAYNTNPAWLESQINKNAADQEKRIAEFGILPVVSGSLSSNRSGQEVENETYGSPFHQNTSQTTTEMGIQVKQNLFKSFQTVNNIRSKDNAAKAQYYAMLKARSDLLSRVIIVYVDVCVKSQALKAYLKKEENLKKLYEAQEVSLEAGMSTPVDVEEARSKYETACYDRITAKNKLIQAKQSYEYLTGLIADENSEFPSLSTEDMPKDIESFKKLVKKNNPEILKYKFSALAADNELDAMRAELGPSVDLVLDARKILNKPENSKSEYANYTKQTKNYSAQVALSMPLFNLQTGGQVGLYSERAKAAKYRAKDKFLEVMSACDVYYDRLNMAEASIKSTRAAIKSAEIASESNLDAVALGVKSNTEFLDSENTLLNAKINFAEAQKTQIEAIVQIYALSGRLDLATILKSLRGATKKKSSILKKK